MKNIKLLVFSLMAVAAFTACEKDGQEGGNGSETEKFTVTVTAEENGKAEANVTEAEAGDEVTFTATPDEGYIFDKWTVMAGNVTIANPTENPLTVIMPKEDIALSASFVVEKVAHAINVTAPENGTIEVADNLAEAFEGTKVTVTATPAEGFSFTGWTITGVDLSAEDLAKTPLEFTMPDAEVTVSAEFEELFDILAATKAYLEEKGGDEGLGWYEDNLLPYFKKHMDAAVRVNNPFTGEEELQAMWDQNADGCLSKEEASVVTVLNFSGEYIPTLSFIEYFTGLEVLEAKGENFEPLGGWGEVVDLSKNEKLKYISFNDCGYFDFTDEDLILGNKPDLEYLDLNYTWCLTLDISKCPKLSYLDIEGTDIQELDITGIEATSGWEFIFDNEDVHVILRKDQEAAFTSAYPDQQYSVK